MHTPSQHSEQEITALMREAVAGASASPHTWNAIHERIAAPTRTNKMLRWPADGRLTAYVALLAVAVIGLGLGVRAALQSSESDVAVAAVVGDESYPVISLGESLITHLADANPVSHDRIFLELELTPEQLAGRQNSTDQLTEGQKLLDSVVKNLATTEFTVSSLQTSRRIEKSMVFNSSVLDYYDGRDLPVYEVAEERDCRTTSIDVDRAGTKTICNFYARKDGRLIGESYSMPIYRVTSGSYDLNGEAAVRIDDRTSTPVPSSNRSTVYHGDVQLWRIANNTVEYRAAISVGNFDLVGGSEWKVADPATSVEPGVSTVEWILAMQLPEWRRTIGEADTESGFVPGAGFQGADFDSVEIVSGADDEAILIEARRPVGYYDHEEVVRITLDATTWLPRSLRVDIEEFMPLAYYSDFNYPVEFTFEYP